MVYILLAMAITIVIMGYYLYYQNCKKNEDRENFLVLPWLIFTLLGAVDCLNIFFDKENTFVGLMAGWIMFLGPLSISVLILQSKPHCITYLEAIKKEWTQESLVNQVYISFSCILFLTVISADICTSFGDTAIWEYSLVFVTILMDLSGFLPLFSEARQENEKQTIGAWMCFGLGSTIALAIKEDFFDIEGILIIENIILSFALMGCVLFYKNESIKKRIGKIRFFFTKDQLRIG